MLTPQDDLLGHQTPGSFAQAGNGDPRFTERFTPSLTLDWKATPSLALSLSAMYN